MAAIDSTFAILDVKRGRKKLARRFEAAGTRVPVTIHGYITNVHSSDDGVSIEFTIEVTDAIERVRRLRPTGR